MTRILSKEEVEEWNQKFKKNVVTVMLVKQKDQFKIIENGYYESVVKETEVLQYFKK